MIISHEQIDSNISSENTYVARDEEQNLLGLCTVAPRYMTLFPDCPRQYAIRAEGDGRALNVLYGAAVARARALATEKAAPARIYAEVEVDDEDSLEVLHALGFTDGDGVVRAYRPIHRGINICQLPSGCSVVRDFLADPMERRFFLERYNQYYGLKNDEEWLNGITDQENFARMIMVSQDGLCGELLVWTQGDEGVIGIIQTARKWRRRGVASYLIEDARQYFASLGFGSVHFDIWLAAPGCRQLARRCGFGDNVPLLFYPEMYI